MKIGIQGVIHSYHHQAAKLFFADSSDEDIVKAKDFAELFGLLEQGDIDVAVCAVENTIYGGINEVYDLLASHENVWIGGEQYLPIHHCLAGVSGTKIGSIKNIYSHPAALGQCQKFIINNMSGAKPHAWRDTAAAALHVAELADSTNAAICSKDAADAGGLFVLAENIEDNSLNTTRFLIIYPSAKTEAKTEKTSLMIDVAHQPGSLFDTLGVFKIAGLNLSMLVSRPIPEQSWKYRFYIDIEAGVDNPAMKSAMSDLSELGVTVKILGSYEKADQK